MTTDALDPGPDGNYPHMPRNPDGSLDTARMPIGLRRQRTPEGDTVLIDVEPTLLDGRRVTDAVPANQED
ncbi:hypothetical protein EUA06_11190 [Nocardioides glacieisoli]|uniref:Uncharacterized protein n=1 Tax=Nocardioides glacieisoli TaxID=1168730 RepID=A0A4Q2RTW2_9ACTN|nr:hypothetical protein [Nocardioides glacieisoli]RYB90833.1 hypothetical protein EUA06_11190 [Nocardioides glacieisoli]